MHPLIDPIDVPHMNRVWIDNMNIDVSRTHLRANFSALPYNLDNCVRFSEHKEIQHMTETYVPVPLLPLGIEGRLVLGRFDLAWRIPRVKWSKQEYRFLLLSFRFSFSLCVKYTFFII